MGNDSIHKISIVVLSYKRPELLSGLIRSLSNIKYEPLEIIVVDNASGIEVENVLASFREFVKPIILEENIGAVARNVGMRSATGEIIITIDDDIVGLDDYSINLILEYFRSERMGCLCFKVIDPIEGKVINWCHHYPVEKFSDNEFLTNEITEGAAAFRRETLTKSGLYPESFFISHEGPDLACRILDLGYDIFYTPFVEVRHYHSFLGRTSWRRYYYDTRNIIWLAIRNYPFWFGVKVVVLGVGGMFVYSVRDGYLKFWLKGVVDALKGINAALLDRKKISSETLHTIKKIEKNKPPFIQLVKKRLFQKGVKI